MCPADEESQQMFAGTVQARAARPIANDALQSCYM
jgi:hypothetical protein